jgi:hypothetical protein
MQSRISKKCQGTEVAKGTRGIPSQSASLFFKPSRNSVMRREEFQASTIDKTVQLILSVEEGVEAETTRGTV